MWALEAPWTDRRDGVLAATPIALLAGLGLGWLVIAALAATEWLPATVLRVASITVAHGGLLAVAITWGAADAGVRLPPRAPWMVIGLVGVGATATAFDPRAAVVSLATPVWLAVLARRGWLVGLGLHPRVQLRPILVGAALGAVLGGHVLYSASQTLGHPLRAEGWLLVLALWAYDIGANILSAECFFRGALFNRLQRRWSFAAAAVVATAAVLLRYLVDPLLPGHVEVLAGALFYMSILGAANCRLLWFSGSLVPGLVSSLLFFLAYRLLAIG